MSGVEAGVDRIVDQIVNPAAMEAEVESVIYRFWLHFMLIFSEIWQHSHPDSQGTLVQPRRLRRLRSRRPWPMVEEYSWRKRKRRSNQPLWTERWESFQICSKVEIRQKVQVGEHHGEEVVEPASEAQEEFSQASSPGPDMAALSPLTPQVLYWLNSYW